MLHILFQQWVNILSSLLTTFIRFHGLRDIRLVPNRAGIAFVEFDSEEMAAPAKAALNNFKLGPEHHMRVDYAKK